jgi:anti-sigma regulatory factor (Ser/Thr protein kinase)
MPRVPDQWGNLVESAAPDVEITFAAAPTAAGEARQAIAGWGLFGRAHQPTLLLLVSELVTNSVRHAGLRDDEEICLRARCDDVCTYVEVCDAGRSGRIPDRRQPGLDALEPGGLGLMLVEEMADRWGVHRRPHQTCVWFELACA